MVRRCVSYCHGINTLPWRWWLTYCNCWGLGEQAYTLMSWTSLIWHLRRLLLGYLLTPFIASMHMKTLRCVYWIYVSFLLEQKVMCAMKNPESSEVWLGLEYFRHCEVGRGFFLLHMASLLPQSPPSVMSFQQSMEQRGGGRKGCPKGCLHLQRGAESRHHFCCVSLSTLPLAEGYETVCAYDSSTGVTVVSVMECITWSYFCDGKEL